MGARRAIRRRRSINAEIQAQMILAAVWIPKRVGLRLRPSLAWGVVRSLFSSLQS